LAARTVARSRVSEIAEILSSPEIEALIADLEAVRWTGRKGYGSRTLIGACLVKSAYALPTWTRVARLLEEHTALADAIGGVPSEWACYRFADKLRRHRPRLLVCIESIIERLRELHPEMGKDVAIDATDIAAYANGMRYVSRNGPERERFSDPDASWGHRSSISTRAGGGYYGFKLHAAVCARTGLPLAWEVDTARESETTKAMLLLDTVIARSFGPRTLAMDKGYDSEAMHVACADRRVLPVIALRMTTEILAQPYEAPECEHGLWMFAGADFRRYATKWRCPTGECRPRSKWIKASRRNPLVPRQSKRHRRLYKGRAAAEREFGRLKHEYGLTPLRVRGLEKVTLHADLVMLARLACALARGRPAALAA
jgi:Transposase DDE domain